MLEWVGKKDDTSVIFILNSSESSLRIWFFSYFWEETALID